MGFDCVMDVIYGIGINTFISLYYEINCYLNLCIVYVSSTLFGLSIIWFLVIIFIIMEYLY